MSEVETAINNLKQEVSKLAPSSLIGRYQNSLRSFDTCQKLTHESELTNLRKLVADLENAVKRSIICEKSIKLEEWLRTIFPTNYNYFMSCCRELLVKNNPIILCFQGQNGRNAVLDLLNHINDQEYTCVCMKAKTVRIHFDSLCNIMTLESVHFNAIKYAMRDDEHIILVYKKGFRHQAFDDPELQEKTRIVQFTCTEKIKDLKVDNYNGCLKFLIKRSEYDVDTDKFKSCQ